MKFNQKFMDFSFIFSQGYNARLRSIIGQDDFNYIDPESGFQIMDALNSYMIILLIHENGRDILL